MKKYLILILNFCVIKITDEFVFSYDFRNKYQQKFDDSW